MELSENGTINDLTHYCETEEAANYNRFAAF